MTGRPVDVSVVVVAYDMAREIPRTLSTLAPSYQRGIEVDRYEVIVVDNGSPTPLDRSLIDGFPGRIRHLRLDPAAPSPVPAANLGIRMAQAPLVGLLIDGARLVSPGLLATADRASRVAERPVVTSPAWHLGPVPHKQAADAGYDQTVEDQLLASVPWEHDGYELFRISTLAGSSGRGIFGAMGESNALFLHRALWDEVGGMDERFTMPGGGLANHDLYRRTCSLHDVEVVVLLGEGTFHQYHGGASTSRRFTWDEMHAEYEAIRGEPHRPPDVDPWYFGRLPAAASAHVEESVRRIVERDRRERRTSSSRG